MNENDLDVKIENIVASIEGIAESFDLNKIKEEIPDTEYNKNKFPGLVYRVKDPKAAFLIFSSGKINCTGSRSIEDVEKSCKILVKDLELIGYKPIKPEIIIQNVVASANLKSEVNLNEIASALTDDIEYEPEQFPGMVYRLRDMNIVVLIFGSGRLVITGARDTESVYIAAKKVRDKLLSLGILKS
ncbi:MAG: TATA-box-binding protein [Candidatus Methanoliparum thermophilum]|uniref:TATA-box-binding protein n=1 Tax=Methanoliparum thermophilum TaxID=2491083 RepID=A0A520KTR2_METT2|nr:TATA-box-binding protein [Candidatus Methanoliparum sp. LAM-1]RZN65469.1 MAG: TATA-box-binding protein [Candidatus Methanoliparum thermophilum]BDC35440.1 transcription factor [Candidatus Methanoliparum sp. LAM-1]